MNTNDPETVFLGVDLAKGPDMTALSFKCPKCDQVKHITSLYGRSVVTYCCGERYSTDDYSKKQITKD